MMFPIENEDVMNSEAQTAKDELLKEWPKGYVDSPGKFEGEPIEVLYFHDLVMNGASDETLYDGETPIDVFFVDEEDRVLWDLDPEVYAVAVWESDQGFVYHRELDKEHYAQLVADIEDCEDDAIDGGNKKSRLSDVEFQEAYNKEMSA